MNWLSIRTHDCYGVAYEQSIIVLVTEISSLTTIYVFPSTNIMSLRFHLIFVSASGFNYLQWLLKILTILVNIELSDFEIYNIPTAFCAAAACNVLAFT